MALDRAAGAGPVARHVLPVDEQHEVLAAVRAVIERPGVPEVDGRVELPYVTASFRYTRRRMESTEEHG